jgi:hypothetical protein
MFSGVCEQVFNIISNPAMAATIEVTEALSSLHKKTQGASGYISGPPSFQSTAIEPHRSLTIPTLDIYGNLQVNVGPLDGNTYITYVTSSAALITLIIDHGNDEDKKNNGMSSMNAAYS